MSIGWGFIGTGNYPNSRIAPAAALAEDTSIVAAYSRDQERAERFVRSHGAQASYTSVERLLADSRVDVVFIASPNHLHAEHAKLAAEAGKHVLVEKPTAVNAEDLLKMLEACEKAGVLFMDGVMFMHNPRLPEILRAMGLTNSEDKKEEKKGCRQSLSDLVTGGTVIPH